MSLNSPERERCSEACTGFFSSEADFIFRGAESRPKGIWFTPTRNCTHFLKIGFGVAGGGFYSYYIHQGNKSDEERNFLKKIVKYYAYKKI